MTFNYLSKPNKERAIVTICSGNYFPYARILLSSLQTYHPEASLFLCLADTLKAGIELNMPEVEIIPADSLNIDRFDDFAFRYDIMEFNTAVKPFVMELLIKERGFEQVVYLDPDIELFAPITPVFDALTAGANFAITPHITQPAEGDEYPDDIGVIKAGIYNLGFIAMDNSSEAIAFLGWWGRKLRFQCFNQQDQGIFVDQKFVDLLPAFHDGVAILRDTTLNVAYWNLYQRKLEQTKGGWTVDEQPLRFFHFSGIDPSNPQRLSKHTARFNGNLDSATQALVDRYLEKLQHYGYGNTLAPEYGYKRFQNKIAIADIMRHCYRDLSEPRTGNPFETFASYLNQPADLVVTFSPHYITKLMYYLWQQRIDLQQAFDLDNLQDQINYALWFVYHGADYGIEDYFIAPISDKLTSTAGQYKLKLLLGRVAYQSKKLLKQSFNLLKNAIYSIN